MEAHADVFNSFGAQCAKAGLKFAYHNHNFEFEAVDGQRPYDVLMAATDPAVVHFELDMYWCKKGGADIVETMTRYSDRITMVHVKDMLPNGDMTDVGLGTIPFARRFSRRPAPRRSRIISWRTTTPPRRSNPPPSARRRWRRFWRG